MSVFLRGLVFAAIGAGCAWAVTLLAGQSPWMTMLAPGVIFGAVFAVILCALRRLSLGKACFWVLWAVFAHLMALFIFTWTVAQNIYPLSLSWPLMLSTINYALDTSMVVDAKLFTRIALSLGGAFAAWFGIGILVRQHKRLVSLPNAGWLLCAACAGGATLGLFMARPDDHDNLLYFHLTCQALFAAVLGWTLPGPMKTKSFRQPDF